MARWDGKPASDLMQKTSTTMPTNAPGSLDPKQYADLVAYLLQVNGVKTNGDLSAATASTITIR
jgi:hypothetical protein